MTWLSPSWLWALPLILAPPIIHWLFRRQHAVVSWGAVEILKRALQRQNKIRRIEELLILLLRVVVIMLLVLGLAQPEMLSAGSGLSATRHPQVVVFDISASTRRQSGLYTAFQRLREEAIEYIEGLDRNRSIFLIMTPGETVIEGQDSIIEQLRSLEPTWFEGDMAKAITKTTALLRDRRIVGVDVALFSDMQSSDFDRIEKWPPDWTVTSHGINFKRGLNRAVAWVKPGPGFPGAGKRWWATTRLVGDPGETNVTLFVDDEILVQRTVSIPESGLIDLDLPVDFIKNGWHEIDVHLEDDTYSHDNNRYLSVKSLSRPNIMLVTNKAGSDGIAVLERALDPRREFNLVLTKTPPTSLKSIDLLLWLSDHPPNGDQANAILDMIDEGGFFGLFPLKIENPSTWSESLPFMASYASELASESKFVPDPTGPYRNWNSYFHPFTFTGYRTLAGGERLLWRDASNRPVLASGSYGRGLWIQGGFSLDESQGNWLASPLYVGFVRSMMTKFRLAAFVSEQEVLAVESHDDWVEPGHFLKADLPVSVNTPAGESDLSIYDVIQKEEVEAVESSAPQPLGLNFLVLVFVFLLAETYWSTARQ